jgi:uncharacterized protein DUF4249
MKYISRQVFTAVLLMLMATACTKTNNTEALVAKAVVEGYLIEGEPIQVKISEESITGTVDSPLTTINNLSLTVINNGVHYVLHNTGDGMYSNTGLIATSGETYQLAFDYNNKTIAAETTIPDKPTGFTSSATTITPPQPPTSGTMPTMPDPVVYNWNNPQNNYHLMVVKCLETSPVEINSGAILIGGSRVFRTEPTQNSTQSLTPMRFKYYGLHEVTLYRILPEYAALYEDNGDNSNNLTAPPGNITNGLGIFTGVHYADKLYITVQQ